MELIRDKDFRRKGRGRIMTGESGIFMRGRMEIKGFFCIYHGATDKESLFEYEE